MNATENERLDNGDIMVLKGIVDENTDMCLYELVFLFGVKIGKFVHYAL